MLWTEYLCPPNSYADILTPDVIGIRRWGLWEVTGSEGRGIVKG